MLSSFCSVWLRHFDSQGPVFRALRLVQWEVLGRGGSQRRAQSLTWSGGHWSKEGRAGRLGGRKEDVGEETADVTRLPSSHDPPPHTHTLLGQKAPPETKPPQWQWQHRVGAEGGGLVLPLVASCNLFFQILIQIVDASSVITWDFDVCKGDIVFNIYHSKRSPQPPKKDSLGAHSITSPGGNNVQLIDRVWQPGRDYSMVESPLICKEGESVQVGPSGIPCGLRISSRKGGLSGFTDAPRGWRGVSAGEPVAVSGFRSGQDDSQEAK